MPSSTHRCLVAALLGSMAIGAFAQKTSSLADLSLEQLTSMEVTSVAKRTQRLADVAGSVYIITADDIRRSGAITLPEALRLAPNLQVARADANQYAITARGFNSVLANKMLVQVDGRTVYSPLFSGVFWEARDVMLADVERIEVLSGAGGTLYGSNAVNGVINVITRSAADTQGVLLGGGMGDGERLLATRYGFHAGDTAVRLYARRTDIGRSELASGAPVRDGSSRLRMGLRADQTADSTHWTLQADAYRNEIDQAPSERKVFGANLLGRYSRDFGDAGRVQLQVYWDRSERRQPGAINESLDTWDIDFQHLLHPWPTHELLWGAGWRRLDQDVSNLNVAAFSLLPTQQKQTLWNVFAQDEFELREKLRLTLGIKAEHNHYTGLEWLPNARLAWEFAPDHLLWLAASRAVRTPARVDRDFYSPVFLGGPNFRSEVARVFELGLRSQPTPSLSWSLALFHHRFDNLRSIDAGAGGLTFNNNYEATLSGLEAWGQWRVADPWRLRAGLVLQELDARARAGSAPVQGVSSLGNDPRYRFNIGSAWDISSAMELDVNLRRVGALPNPAVPAYTAVDLRWGWRVHSDLELSLTLRNLVAGRHPEWGAAPNRAEFDRGAFLKAVWRM